MRGTRALVLAGIGGMAAVSLMLLAFRFVDPPTSALMFTQALYGQEIDNRWVPLSRVSPNLVRAVILSEDNKFCSHFGIDMGEMRAALDKAEREGEEALRGASTISQQVAKNLALWPGRSALRKVLELGVTLPMEVLWPKARIMEVYLNIAEWGPGIFGAEAASQYHFSKPASRLTQREAALLAVALPNPFERVAGKPGQGTQRLAATIEGRMSAASGSPRFDCVLRAKN
ncbi:MAG: monofunctional biosynthetic peptidoglycan transglycosylase [Hyphomicrobiaceae bacterium]